MSTTLDPGEEHDATELVELQSRGATTALELCRAALDRARTDRFGAFSGVADDTLLERARSLDEQRERGEPLGALHGVPIAIKSNLCARGFEAHAGSRALAGHRPLYDATVVARSLATGAVVIGTTHMDEFGMGSTGENSAHGTPTNPHARGVERLTAGGSSSGSAAAVASGVVPLAFGSDTGGSVRQPASFCGLFGFKPTWGRISRHGLIAFASSLDTVGILARSARDIERLLAVVAGADMRDATAYDDNGFAPQPNATLAGRRIGVLAQSALEGVSNDVANAYADARTRLESHGARLCEIELPHAKHAVATYYVIATAEASSNLARYDGVRYGARTEGDGSLASMYAATRSSGFGDEVMRRVTMGTHALSSGFYDAWFERAARVRRRIADDFAAAFEQVDLVACPTTPTAAFALGEILDPLTLYRGDALTLPASLAGLPAVSVPLDVAPGALPVGLQLIGPAAADAAVLGAARAFAPLARAVVR